MIDELGGNCLDGLEKTTKSLGYGSRCPAEIQTESFTNADRVNCGCVSSRTLEDCSIFSCASLAWRHLERMNSRVSFLLTYENII